MNIDSIKTLARKNPLGSSAALFSILLIIVVYFRHGALQSTEAVLGEKAAEGERLKSNVTYSTNMAEHLAQITAANDAVSKRLVRSSELAINLQYFYKIEAETGVKLGDLQQQASTPSKDAPKGAYTTVPYSARLEGSFTNILMFLRRLEQGWYYSRIISASVETSGGDGADAGAKASDIVQLNITLELLGKPL
jgi:Tfp pilus assembly protein PilO